MNYETGDRSWMQWSTPALETRAALQRVVQDIPGVKDVRLLDRSRRSHPGARHKAFVVLATHDVNRDRKIVEVMCQLYDLDFDLVPAASEGMIPGEAESLLH